MKKIISKLLLLIAFISARGDATFPESPFWPLAIGNKWVYEFEGNLTGPMRTASLEIEVTDRVIEGGRTYYVISDYPGTAGPFAETTLKIRYNPQLKKYVYREKVTGQEKPLIPEDSEGSRTTKLKGNAGGWDLENAMKFHECRGCRPGFQNEWILKEGLGVVSRYWVEPSGITGTYILKEAYINGKHFYPGYQKDGLNIEVRAKPDRMKVRFEMIIRNLSKEEKVLSFPSARNFDFVVYNKEKSHVLWEWSSGQFFLETFEQEVILPGEEVKHEVTWNYYNRDETLIRAGTLFVEGVLPLTENEIRIDSIPFQAGSGLVAEGSNAIAEERLKESALEIVIDYSKSMLDDIGRQKKYKVVLNGLENMFLSDVMDDHLVAARVFGSSDSPGCNLTSVIHPLEPFKPYKALISLEDLIPGTRGMSAIGRALTSAYHDLKDHSGPKSIFLITDGGDSCGNAKYINDLRDVLSGNAKYKDFSIDVFGFNLDSKFMDLYKDFAQKTGGDFYPFGTFIELSSYLEDLSNVHLNGGQLEIVSENENGERFLVLDSYNSPVAYGSVGKPVRVLEGTYSIQIPNSKNIQVPGLNISKGRRTILFLEERIAELEALENIEVKIAEMNPVEEEEESGNKGGKRGIR